jgi:hypothetical protein
MYPDRQDHTLEAIAGVVEDADCAAAAQREALEANATVGQCKRQKDKTVAEPIKRFGSVFPVNEFVATRLREAADLLAAQQDNPFRAGAYRQASNSIASLDHSVEELLRQGGVEVLDRIPHVGKGIAAAIAEMATTGRWAYLQRLRGSAEPEDVFCAVPGVGPKLARRLHEELNVATLEQLEAALADPKLAAPKGLGERRISMIRLGLRHLLDRMRPRRSVAQVEPSVEILLDVDREYREKVALDGFAPHRAQAI